MLHGPGGGFNPFLSLLFSHKSAGDLPDFVNKYCAIIKLNNDIKLLSLKPPFLFA
jgi:hypothetical protein